MSSLTQNSMVYVHGAKHLLDASRKIIWSHMRWHYHDMIVDPFCGSGALDLMSQASAACVNIVGLSEEEVAAVQATLLSKFASVAVAHEDARLFTAKAHKHVADAETLLLIDPPRPDSKHYQAKWSYGDIEQMYALAILWPGPVIMCGYTLDQPQLIGGGWITTRVQLPEVVDYLIGEGCGYAPQMFVSSRGHNGL